MKKILFAFGLLIIASQVFAKDIFAKHSKKYANPKKIEWGVSIDQVKLAEIAKPNGDSVIVFKTKMGSAIYGDVSYELTYYFNEKGLYKVKEKYSSGIVPAYKQSVINVGLNKNNYFENLLGKPDYTRGAVLSENWGEYKPAWLAKSDRSNIPGIKINLHISKITSIALTIVTMTKE